MYNGMVHNRNGVGFLIKKELKENVIDFIPISDRVARLIIHIENRKFNIIQVYAPTEKAPEKDIQTFYRDLRLALKESGRDTIVMGDFNAQVGMPNADDKEVMGPWGYGKRSPRGNVLIEFCCEQRLYITNTHYKKKLKRKWTWLHPNGVTRNEIDYILSRNKAIIENVDIIPTTYASDHRLVRASLPLALKHNITSRKHFGPTRTAGFSPIEKDSLKNIFTKEIENVEVTEIESTYNALVSKIQISASKLPIQQQNADISPMQKEIEALIVERTSLKEKENKSRTEKKRLSNLYRVIKKKLERSTYTLNKLKLKMKLE